MEQTTREHPDFLGVPALKSRGWTARLISQYLGEPDSTRPNPHYRSAPPMRLYALARVEAVEQSHAWQAAQQQTRRRQDAAGKAVQTKRQTLLQAIACLNVHLPMVEAGTLIRQACEHYNAFNEHRDGWDDWTPATPQSDPVFLARITVNYLRHQLTRYERDLAAIYGKVGVREAYLQLNKKVYDALAQAYPALAAECARQYREKCALEAQQSGEEAR